LLLLLLHRYCSAAVFTDVQVQMASAQEQQWQLLAKAMQSERSKREALEQRDATKIDALARQQQQFAALLQHIPLLAAATTAVTAASSSSSGREPPSRKRKLNTGQSVDTSAAAAAAAAAAGSSGTATAAALNGGGSSSAIDRLAHAAVAADDTVAVDSGSSVQKSIALASQSSLLTMPIADTVSLVYTI
jgi:hypothetical protein